MLPTAIGHIKSTTWPTGSVMLIRFYSIFSCYLAYECRIFYLISNELLLHMCKMTRVFHGKRVWFRVKYVGSIHIFYHHIRLYITQVASTWRCRCRRQTHNPNTTTISTERKLFHIFVCHSKNTWINHILIAARFFGTIDFSFVRLCF